MIRAAPVLEQPSIELAVSWGRPPQMGLAISVCCPPPERCDLQKIDTMARAWLGAQELPAPLGMQVKEADVLEMLHLTHSELDFHSTSRASWRPLYNSKALKPVGSCERPGLFSLHIYSFQTYKSSPGLQPPQAKPWKRGAESMQIPAYQEAVLKEKAY